MAFRGRPGAGRRADRRLGHSGRVRVSRRHARRGRVQARAGDPAAVRALARRAGAGAHLRYVPVELHDLLYRALGDDAVNRPAAGEWQRALRGLLADGRLNERYPGPAPAPRVVVRAVPPVAPGLQGAAPGVAPTPGTSTGPRTAGTVRLISPGFAQRAGAAASQLGRPVARAVPQTPLTGSVWLRRAVVVAWIVAGTAVLLLAVLAAVRRGDPGASGWERRRGLDVRSGRHQLVPVSGLRADARSCRMIRASARSRDRSRTAC